MPSLSRSCALFIGLGIAVAGCYTLQSTATLMSTQHAWSGTGHLVVGGPKHSVGLAGQDIYAFNGGALAFSWTAPLTSQFGGAYVLTSIAQPISEGFHEHTFVHGNRVGRSDNRDLLYTFQVDFTGMRWVRAWDATVWDGGQYYDVVQICDLAAADTGAYGLPNDSSSHLFMSMRACPRSSGPCAGGILEVAVDPGVTAWWVKSNQEGVQSSLRKPDGTLFSDECMPIAVTSVGGQSRQYLVVGDPSWDELSLFDALRLWEGPRDSVRAEDATRNIKAVAVEGRREGSLDLAFLSVLWSGTSGGRIEHRAIASGTFYGDTPQLTENVPADIKFIESQGSGAQGTTADLFSYGNQVIRRRYQQP